MATSILSKAFIKKSGTVTLQPRVDTTLASINLDAVGVWLIIGHMSGDVPSYSATLNNNSNEIDSRRGTSTDPLILCGIANTGTVTMVGYNINARDLCTAKYDLTIIQLSD